MKTYRIRLKPHCQRATDANGSRVKLSDYKGKVVLLNFWATWCGPCKIEIPWFIEFGKAYNSRGFAVLGVALDKGGWKAVKPFVTQKGMNYPVVVGNDSVAELYGGIDSLPTTFLIDRDGGIASTHVGLVSKSEYRRSSVDPAGATVHGWDHLAEGVVAAGRQVEVQRDVPHLINSLRIRGEVMLANAKDFIQGRAIHGRRSAERFPGGPETSRD